MNTPENQIPLLPKARKLFNKKVVSKYKKDTSDKANLIELQKETLHKLF